MFKIHSVEIQGFKSFAVEQTFQVPNTKSGLYLITGKNLKDTELGANGAGKSSIFDAMVWCLYGKTARGSKGKSVENWKGTPTPSVSVTYTDIEGNFNTITRTRSPNSLVYIDGKTETHKAITQNELEKIVGVDYVGFLNIVLMSQFGRYFLDVSASEKLQLLSESLKLSQWDERSREAALKATECAKVLDIIDKDSQELRNFKSYNEATINSEKSFLQVRRKEKAQYETDQQDRLDKIRIDLFRLRKSMAETRLRLKSVERLIAKVESDKGIAERKVKTYVNRIQNLQSDEKHLAIDFRNLDAERNAAASMQGSCPTCGQRIDAESIESVLELISAKKSMTMVSSKSTVSKKRKLSKNLAIVQRKLEAIRTKHAELKKRRELLIKRQASEEAEDGMNRKHQKAITDHKLDYDETATLRKIEKLRKRIEYTEDELDKNLQDAEAEQRSREFCLFWQKRFKDIRLVVVREAVLELEVNSNNALAELGLPGWNIKFDVERLNASGGITKGFSVFIQSPGSTDSVPFESWSGGESQRLRIAVASGLASLMSSRYGVEFAIEVWDEPTAHLSPEGIESLLTFFKKRAQETNKNIFVIDHRSLHSGEFEGTYVVTKSRIGASTITKEKDGTHRRRTRIV